MILYENYASDGHVKSHSYRIGSNYHICFAGIELAGFLVADIIWQSAVYYAASEPVMLKLCGNSMYITPCEYDERITCLHIIRECLKGVIKFKGCTPFCIMHLVCITAFLDKLDEYMFCMRRSTEIYPVCTCAEYRTSPRTAPEFIAYHLRFIYYSHIIMFPCIEHLYR